ncbi:vacuolar protein sorting protein [Sporothrix brasiliensis 5110]|uniref:Vacuolar protein sorting/targeting protein 10 n=1 Tax=Sporothrix brasiliensis 5110 TaxID=1398154 RepID=A0A0C2JDZ4_9PEZI|nr:vacuolar protein sorting protein [Sporothrix brasiliensis 5110]KIH95132.1 vacuolar protein sorting protein [Sporothrix brasiliensis 5110]
MRVSSALHTAAALAAPLWALFWAISPAAAAADGPTFHVSAFGYQPDNLNYFEDSDVILFHDFVEGLIYRSADAGAHWDKVTAIPAMAAVRLVMHEYHPERAFVLTEGITHYRTEDRGKTWQSFLTDAESSMFQYDVLTFHAADPDRIIFNGMDYDATSFSEVAMYTTDGFRTDAQFLRGNTAGCWWAKGSELFTTGAADLDASRILCIVRDTLSPFKQDQRLLVSDNYFKAVKADGVVQEFEPNLDTNRPVQGIVNIAAVKKYLLVATTSLNTDEMALFVTDDTLRWHRAVFPADHRINQESYTVLESTNYSIQIDVMNARPSDPTGVLFTSNSNGTFFTQNLDYTNRNKRGHVDFEKISGIQGIFLVNRVENGEAVKNDRVDKKIVSEITFDDGRTFAPVGLRGQGKERLHLHSVTDLSNVGRVFSSPAPGLVMAVGNTGDYLGHYKDGSLFISDDAGLTWIEGPKGPHKYEFGDQGSILLAVRDAADVDEVTYSLDHGTTWTAAKLPDGLQVRPYILTTTQDSTSLKFVLVGEAKDRWHIIAIDFAGLHEATCKDSDLEDWWARVDDKGQPTCLMGHTQKYHRRKKDAACFLKQEFKDPVVETTDCDCTDLDFECDYNFRRSESGTECVRVGPLVLPEGSKVCSGKDAKPDDVFMGSSGWRLIPGNTCRRTGGKQKDDLVEHKCSETGTAPNTPASGEIANTPYDFQLSEFTDFEKHYLERGDSSSDTADSEAIIMRPIQRARGEGGPIYVTNDHGKTWTHPEVLDNVGVWAIIPHEYFKEMVFFVTTKEHVVYTVDYGKQYHEFQAPYPPDVESERSPLLFHPDHKDWLIWIGKKCESTGACYTEASFSRDRGDNWVTLLRYVERCEFIGSSAYKNRKPEEVVCLVHAREEDVQGDGDANPLQLVSSTDWFETKVVHEANVKGFATMAEFIVVAAEDKEKSSLRALASLDGETYAEARFPVNFAVPKQHEYTVLDSSTHAVNLFVATETGKDRRYGTILKSNSNGTSYVMSIAGVNCDNRYYVDFEKMLGLEGVVVVNVVANRDDAKATAKKLQTKISHNDGAEWAFLPPPPKDVDNNNYGCTPRKGAREGGDESCALHIHGYTEREDHRKTFSSSGAVGLMFGVGNVGDQLGPIGEADTFMTTDAGLTWRNVKKGAWTWQFGDQGSIVVLVPRNAKTRTVSFTTDEGATFRDHQFSDEEVEVLDITTLRSGASRNFLLWCRSPGRDHVFTINVDFSGLTDRPCEHDDKDAGKSDYYLWSPSHPLLPESSCLFGHVSRYLRKKTDRTCYNGYKIRHLYNTENCTCTRRDYECDYNFELDNHGQCSLVPGLAPMSKKQWCSEHPDAVEYYPPTGFRRIPLTTCEGGDESDKTSEPKPCQDHEDEFARKHSGPGAFAIAVIVLVSVGAAAAVAWYVYRNWTGKFGAIRLGEGGSSRFTVDSDAPYIKYPIMAAAGVVAVVGTLPLLATALWRTATGALERRAGGSSGGGARGAWSRLGLGLGLGGGGSRRFTTRDSFARGRGDYAIVDDDEGELLGDDSDEDV